MREYRSCSEINGMELKVQGDISKGTDELALCCEPIPNKPATPFADTPEETVKRFLAMRSLLVAQSVQGIRGEGTCVSGCEKCDHYRMGKHEPSGLITAVDFGLYPAPCQCRCCYCTVPKQWIDTPEVAAGYERVFQTLETARRMGVIAPDAQWSVATGEISIHPYKERILELVRGERTRFHTNAFLFDEGIARHLHENAQSSIECSIDAGTAESWHKVKGFDNYNEVVSNLEQYRARSARPGQVTLKYIVLPGLNDSEEDFKGVVQLMKRLETRHLGISRDSCNEYDPSGGEKQTALMNSTARLITQCKQNDITFGMVHYVQGEKEKLEGLTGVHTVYHRPGWKSAVNALLEKAGYTIKRVET